LESRALSVIVLGCHDTFDRSKNLCNCVLSFLGSDLQHTMAAVLFAFGKCPGAVKRGREVQQDRRGGNVKLYNKAIKPRHKERERLSTSRRDTSSQSFQCSQDAQRSGDGTRPGFVVILVLLVNTLHSLRGQQFRDAARGCLLAITQCLHSNFQL
jgi:hypothetical protein